MVLRAIGYFLSVLVRGFAFNNDGSLVSPTAITILYRDLVGIERIQFVQESVSYLKVNILKNHDYTDEVSTILKIG